MHEIRWISIILKSVTSSTEQTSSTPYSNRSPLPKECIALLEELTKQVYDNEELNNNKIQTLFSMFARVNFDFTRLNNVIENKLYQKLLVFWENSGVSENFKSVFSIAATCSLEEFPLPVMDCFIFLGEYSKIGRLRDNAAAIATPCARPSFSITCMFFP